MLRDYVRRLKNPHHDRGARGDAAGARSGPRRTGRDRRPFLDNQDPVFGEQARAEFRELYHRVVSLAPSRSAWAATAAARLDRSAAPAVGDLLLKVSGLESSYGRIKALKGLNLEVRRGETVALVGANGAARRFFLRTLSGVQPMAPGQIWFDGDDISKLRSDRRMRRGICQSPEGRQVFGPLSIEDNLLLGAYTQPRQQVPEDPGEGLFDVPDPEGRSASCRPARSRAASSRCWRSAARLMGRPSYCCSTSPRWAWRRCWSRRCSTSSRRSSARA